ncbi:MAG: T9SS type A sorting domain-containing protein, partial [Saprospiraceae bacterium]
KAGHKFPSGYPSRRAWVEFVVKDQTGAELFHSGRMNPDGSLPDEDANFEPHYNRINRPDQVQIYELVPGDVNGIFSNVLERGHAGLKDNRLVPEGFSWADPVYDTTQVIGVANDPDFNRSPAGLEGTGADVLHFSIPNGGYMGFLQVTARVWYQSLPPKWLAPMFAFSSPEIDSFQVMLANSDQAPVLIAEQTMDSLYVSPTATKNRPLENLVSIAPTLTNTGIVLVRLSPELKLRSIQVFDIQGRLCSQQSHLEVQLPLAKGIYYVAVLTDRGRVVQKVVRE